MKRNNVAKKLGIASLCLAMAVSAFSGLASLNNNVAAAEGTTVAAENFVTVSEGATAKQETITVQGATSYSADYAGLHISSDTEYSAKLNTVFSGNTTFKFRFPEYKSTYIAGDFKFRITDVNDDSNYFDLVYYVISDSRTRANNGTGVYVQYGTEIRTVSGYDGAWSNEKLTSCSGSKYTGIVPYFNSLGGAYNAKECQLREGVLSLTWTDDVLAVTVPDGLRSIYSQTRTVAKFDGTDTFVASTSCGLPKVRFPNGYKVSISSEYSTGTDVFFSSITTGGATYDFTQETITKDNNMKAYDTMTASENAGKALLGWKDATGLQTTATALKSADISAYTPVFLGFDTVDGASVRIDTSEGGQSGIRFMTLFDKADYEEAEAYIQSQGTLIAYTDALNLKNFTHANYETEINAATAIAQVPLGSNGGKMFDYEENSKTYKAYTMALVDITNYTQKYSARGYLVVQYADGSTQYVYTDYNANDNSRSIAEVAYKLQQSEEYTKYLDAQKTIVDGYAVGYVPEA